MCRFRLSVQQYKISLERKGGLSLMGLTIKKIHDTTWFTWHQYSSCGTPARTVGGRELQHLAVRISVRSFECFMGVQKKDKWSGFRKESIINQACIFRGLLKKPSLTHQSCSNLYFILGNIEGRNQWMIYKSVFLMNWTFQKVHVWGLICANSVCFHNVIVFHPVYIFPYWFTLLWLLYFCFCLILSRFCHLTWHIMCHLHMSIASGKWKQQPTVNTHYCREQVRTLGRCNHQQ